jgi:RNA polymerase sigma-70 factor (ECF subfamily)
VVEARAPGHDAPARPDDETLRALLRRYVQAWETGAPERFASLLREDALLTMPPIPSWFRGARAIASFVAWIHANAGELRFLETEAAGTLAVAAYVRARAEATFHANGIHVVRWDGDRVAHTDAFMIPHAFARFGLPDEIT